MSSSSPPQATIFFQDACLSHRYIRSRDTSTIVERPQRIHAVKTGVAAAIARLEQRKQDNTKDGPRDTPERDDVLANALERLNLAESRSGTEVVNVVMSTASVDILNHPAVKYVHGDIDGDVYLEKLVSLARESEEKVARGESEIPEGLSQGDLYLCGGSLNAIQGAVGTVCEAVDGVIRAMSSPAFHIDEPPQAGPSRTFVVIRPPGHHCGEDTPQGFCFINNVAVGAAHAHLKHGISRAVVLDIDLHHGNGTQSIAWQINEETYRQQLESEVSDVPGKPPLRMYYGSIHDVLSYPCEDGNAAIIQAASVSLHGPHGQHIENVHLLPYTSDADFWDRLYCGPYTRLLQKAEAFLKEYEDSGEAIVFISAGFDASEHEYSSMSRHGRKVPTSFYYRFAHDVRKLSDKYAKGRIVSVLEGGYSDRALFSGAMAHVLGLVEEGDDVDENWWSPENLTKIEKATKKRRGGRTSMVAAAAPEKWVERTLSLLSEFDPNSSPPSTPKAVTPITMTLRDRSKKANASTQSASASDSGTPPPKLRPSASAMSRGGLKSAGGTPVKNVEVVALEVEKVGPVGVDNEDAPKKKLPRVVLRVNPPTPADQDE